MLVFNQKNTPIKTILSLEGELIWENEFVFTDRVQHIAANRHLPLIIDMYKVNFIDSAGVGALLKTIDHFERRGLTVHICRVNHIIKPIMSTFMNPIYFEDAEKSRESSEISI